ncbi:MAG: DUF748 domain-containing protein, partial [Deltaproteobacteria bacterium]|nr:DUF748 domain-containing protein [Deltaproteobacteria bacterium]
MILGLAGFLLGSLTGACCYRSDLASLLLRKVLARLQRPGAELGVERIQPRGLGGVTLYGLRFTTRAGPENGGALAVQLEAVQLRWSVSALWAGQLRLTTVELLAPRVSLDMRQGLGTVLRELEPLRALLAARRAGAAPAPQQPGGPAAALPELSIVGGQLELVGLGLGLEDLRLSSRQDADPDGGYLLEGTLRPLGLKGGPCRIAGKLGQGLQQGEVVLDCDTPLTLQREDVALHAPRLRLSIGQSSSLVAEQERERLLLSPALAGGVERLNIAVPSLEVVAPVPGDAQPRPRLFGAVRVVLGEDTMVGVEADLHTPPAGRVIVLGHLLPQQRQVALDLHVEGLDLARSPLPALLPGRLTSGVLDADVAVDLVEHGQRLDVIGRVKVSDVELYHESLTRDPVPFTSL